GLERWWRHVLGGAASARFHRPPSGLGLSELSMNSVKVAREIEKTVKLWDLDPANDLLSQREENEAYLAAQPGKYYVLFFTDGGDVEVNFSGNKGKYVLKWYNVRSGQLVSEDEMESKEKILFSAPGDQEWIALISKK
ncbi:MAG: hypothetical protein JW761_15195, partial [Prolixibacteraceae bacterium]|nr:hypothetical protein [Prolixibacteraceae bacterium]